MHQDLCKGTHICAARSAPRSLPRYGHAHTQLQDWPSAPRSLPRYAHPRSYKTGRVHQDLCQGTHTHAATRLAECTKISAKVRTLTQLQDWLSAPRSQLRYAHSHSYKTGRVHQDLSRGTHTHTQLQDWPSVPRSLPRYAHSHTATRLAECTKISGRVRTLTQLQNWLSAPRSRLRYAHSHSYKTGRVHQDLCQGAHTHAATRLAECTKISAKVRTLAQIQDWPSAPRSLPWYAHAHTATRLAECTKISAKVRTLAQLQDWPSAPRSLPRYGHAHTQLQDWPSAPRSRLRYAHSHSYKTGRVHQDLCQGTHTHAATRLAECTRISAKVRTLTQLQDWPSAPRSLPRYAHPRSYKTG